MTVVVEASRPAAPPAGPASWSWGALPLLSLTTAVGLLAVAAGNRAGQVDMWWAQLAFYGGLLLLVLPIGLRLVLPAADGTERVSLVALLAIGLFLAKVLHDPLRVGGYDEFLHLRTAQDILASGTVFTPNTLLGVSPYYPGLELTTTALASVSGLGIHESGTIVLAAARVVFLVSLFFFFAMVSRSTRVAGIACLVYMANPMFLYFNAGFSYESLALPLAALSLYLIMRRGHSGPARWTGLTIIALVALAAVVTTHHVTSIMLAGFLVLWSLVGWRMRRHDRSKPGRMALVALTMIVGWTLLVATATIGYLAPALTATVTELFRLVAGEVEPRALFVSRIGEIAPLWERIAGAGSSALIVFLLPFGLFVVWRRYRSNTAMVTLALIAALYPFTLAARLTRAGADISARTPEFLFIAIGLVVAIAVVRLSFQGRRGQVQIAAAAGGMAVLFVGGLIIGVPGWGRLPGPYLVSADSRSVETEGIHAAEWASQVLGPGNLMVADRVNTILQSTYGQQEMVTTYETRLPVRRLFLTPDIGPVHSQIIRDGGIRYLLIDRRLSTGLPAVGHYYDRGDARLRTQDKPIDPQILAKWDANSAASRVFDSGNIQLYDVSALALQTE